VPAWVARKIGLPILRPLCPLTLSTTLSIRPQIPDHVRDKEREKLLLNDFNDALRVDRHMLGFSKVNNDMIILGRTEVSGGGKRV
jgi:hypothetical protein